MCCRTRQAFQDFGWSKVSQPPRINRALSAIQQLRSRWNNQHRGHDAASRSCPHIHPEYRAAPEPSCPAILRTMLQTGHHGRSLQEVMGRASLHGTPAETLKLPHLKVMESFSAEAWAGAGQAVQIQPFPSRWATALLWYFTIQSCNVRVSHVRNPRNTCCCCCCCLHAESVSGTICIRLSRVEMCSREENDSSCSSRARVHWLSLHSSSIHSALGRSKAAVPERLVRKLRNLIAGACK